MSDIISVKSVAELEAHHKSGLLTGLFDVPNEIYHAGPGISSSDLKEILKSPAHYRFYKETEKKQTDAMLTGTLIHMAVLESKLFAESVVVAPPCDRRTTAGKAVWADFCGSSAGKTIVDESQYKMISDIATAISLNKLARPVLSGEYSEVSVYWTDAETGVLCKARADHINGDLIIDLKSCNDASARAFQTQIKIFDYDLSAAFYLDGFATVLPVKMFAWLAVEKTPPYGCRFYTAEETLLHAGRLECRQALESFAKCLKEDSWPAYPAKFENMSLTATYEG